MVVYKSVGTLCPFEDDVWPLARVHNDKLAYQLPALSLQHPHGDLDACVAQLLDAPAVNLGKWVYTPYHHAAHPLAHHHVGARRRASIMRAGLQTYVERGLRYIPPVGLGHRREAVYLGMGASAAYVVTLADDAVAIYQYRAHHGVRFGVGQPVDSQLQAAAHVFFVSIKLVHVRKYL